MNERFHSISKPSKVNKDRLLQLLSDFPKKSILVVGDVGVDKYTYGEVSRISPEAPVPVLEVTGEQRKLGLAANVAENIKTLGSKAFLSGVIGNDRNGEDFLSLMKEASLDLEGIQKDPNKPTCFKERVVAVGQQVVRIDYEKLDPIKSEIQDQLFAKVEKLIDAHGISAVILEDYQKGLISNDFIQKFVTYCQEKNLLLAMDPNRDTPLEYYSGVTFMTPNLQEAEALAKRSIKTSDDLIAVGEKLLADTKAKFLMITLGKEGMALFDGTKPCRIPTFAREVFDVSGAGDTAIATITLALVSGANLQEAATLGNAASGIVVGKQGTATVTPQEIKEFLENNPI